MIIPEGLKYLVLIGLTATAFLLIYNIWTCDIYGNEKEENKSKVKKKDTKSKTKTKRKVVQRKKK